jgi:hypothetical protein
MKIWARTSKIVGTALLKSMAISGIAWAQLFKHPKGTHFSLIPTEETI